MFNGFKIKNLYNEIMVSFVFLYLGSVYFSMALPNIIIGIILFLFVLGIFLNKLTLDVSRKNVLVYGLVAVPMVLTLISVLQSEQIGEGLKFIWKRLPILTIPLVIVFCKQETRPLKLGLTVFLLLSICSSLVTLSNAIKYSNDNLLFQNDLTHFITIIQHPYFGIYTLIALVSLIEFRLIKNKLLFLSTAGLLVTTIILSTSRLVYLMFLFGIIFYGIKFIKTKYRLLPFAVLIIVSAIVLSKKTIRTEFSNSFNYENSPRLKMWNNGLKVVSFNNKEILGIGIADFYENKKDPYYLKDSNNGVLGYNPDSQIVEFYITNGFLGLSILLLALVLSIALIRTQNYYALYLFIILVSFTLTESVFSRQYGVQLFSVFFPLIFNDLFKKNEALS